MKRVAVLLAVAVSLLILSGALLQYRARRAVPLPVEGLSLTVEPRVARVIEVRRADGTSERYVKEDDPIVLPWYSLVANNMFGLRYTSKALWVPNVDGVDRPDLDTGYGGCETQLLAYVSDKEGSPNFETYALPEGSMRMSEVVVWDASSATEYRVEVEGLHTYAGGSLIVRQTFVTLRYCSTGGVGEVVFIADAVNPPVFIRSGDTIYVKWTISFPKPCPYLDGFWEAVKPFLGLRSSVDYGVDSSAGDSTRELLFFSVGSKSAPFTEVETQLTEHGLILAFKGSLQVEGSVRLTSLPVSLRTDADPSGVVRVRTLQVFVGEGVVDLNAGDLVTVVVHITMRNLFT